MHTVEQAVGVLREQHVDFVALVADDELRELRDLQDRRDQAVAPIGTQRQIASVNQHPTRAGSTTWHSHRGFEMVGSPTTVPDTGLGSRLPSLYDIHSVQRA